MVTRPAVVVLALLWAAPAHGQDATLTPGAVATSDPAVFCPRDYPRTHRVWTDKADTLRRYGIPPSDGRFYEDDDRVPICLGGDNASPLNHWTERWAEARNKDHFEAWTCRAVCDGRLSVEIAQGWFLGDWRAAYRQIFHEEP